MIRLDPFYLLVDGAGWLTRLLPLGLRLVQLRIKDRPRSEILSEVRAAKALCAAHDATLIVNDYWDLAIKAGCDFVHLGQGDLDAADIRRIRAADLRVGISTHDHAELERALSFSPDYVALGPIWPTVLKAMAWAPQGLARVAEWRGLLGPIPLVAIGGLTPERGRAVLDAGADSAAVMTDVLRHPDPEARAREWLAATRRPA